jgi:hypothetical protein
VTHTMAAATVLVYRYSGATNSSDMITMGVSMWQRLYARHGGGERPVFVGLGCSSGAHVVGRVQPDARLNWEPGRVEIPEWMWLQLGAPDSGTPFEMEPLELHDVGAITLRPRRRAVVEGGGDLVAILTAELSGGRWAVLMAGMELALDCGVFDVLGVRDLIGSAVAAGCILNQDVTVELEAALDVPVARVATPPPSPPAVLLPPPSDDAGSGMSFPGMGAVMGAGQRRAGGFQPFSGAGNRLT